MLCKRMEYPKLKRAVREQREAFEVRVVLIEDKASGTRLIHELVADGLRAVTRSRTRSCACRPDEGSARPGRPRAPNRLLSSSRYYQKAIFHGEKCGRYWGAKGHQLDFVPSRCLRTRRASARVLVYSTGGAQGLKPKERPALDRRC